MCHGSTNFRLQLMRSCPMDGILSGTMASLSPYNDELSVVAISLQEQKKHGLTTSPMVFPAKISRLPPEGSMEYDICPPTCDLLPFLGYKNLVLRLVGSLRADVDQFRTNLEDHDSLLGNSCANTPLRVHS